MVRPGTTRSPMEGVDFSLAPFIAFWEVTRACALCCRHCRATAQPHRHPEELSTQEGFQLIDQMASMKVPLMVFTGGDPLMRPDLFELIHYAAQAGLRVSLAPSATPKVTRQALEQAREAGVARISFSLDGSSPESQDRFRGRPGSFKRTMEILEGILALRLSFQINTTVSRYNIQDLDNLASMVTRLRPALWDLFFLVPTGRGRLEDMLSPQQHEEVFGWLYRFSLTAPFDIKTTAAQHYRRVVLQAGGGSSPGLAAGDGVGRAKGVNDGNGCLFVSHLGEVYPSGFLPVVGGQVRHTPLPQIYRHSPPFLALRDPDRLKGKCGRCEFRRACGGSRARAYAVTGDYLEAEPYCVYQPGGESGQGG